MVAALLERPVEVDVKPDITESVFEPSPVAAETPPKPDEESPVDIEPITDITEYEVPIPGDVVAVVVPWTPNNPELLAAAQAFLRAMFATSMSSSTSPRSLADGCATCGTGTGACIFRR